MDCAPFLSGRLLLAMPGIGDPRFDRAVIAMCTHDEEGALGIGIGRHVPGVTLHTLMTQLGVDPGGAPDCPIHMGGPVEPHRGFLIHSDDWAGEASIDVAGLWRLTSTLDVLKAIAEGRGPARWLVALGYAGWGAGQLDSEIAANGWFDVAATGALLYDVAPEDRWSAAFAQSGVDVRMLSANAGHA